MSLDISKLKIGYCFQGTATEGVVVNLKDDEADVILNYVFPVISNCASTEIYGSKEVIMNLDDFDAYSECNEPHFCTMNNLFSVMEKYFLRYEKIYFAGVMVNRQGYFNINTDYAYLITDKHTLIEISVCYHNVETNKYETPLIWIKEYDNYFDAHFPKEGKYYFEFDEFEEVKLEDIHDKYELLTGITIRINDKKIAFDICSSIDAMYRKTYINGLNSNYIQLYDTKDVHKFKIHLSAKFFQI